ncbi:hypothetical protein [Paraburkholderia terrae]|jgi:hypothetical protein|uniref:hypothetical protein n=1 Tax=Paraburkholderia terrae TaxID=311230 RepID=UPI001EE37464|nr:hypothetical protein [Paraburkholderia terrae]GJH03943.1 hypothetical protein CBA19C8_25320 [Paraburkholderia terrae]
MKNWMLAYQVVVWLSAALFFDSGLALNRDARKFIAPEAADANGIARAQCVAAVHELIALGIVECSLDILILVLQKRRNIRVNTQSRMAKSTRARR